METWHIVILAIFGYLFVGFISAIISLGHLRDHGYWMVVNDFFATIFVWPLMFLFALWCYFPNFLEKWKIERLEMQEAKCRLEINRLKNP